MRDEAMLTHLSTAAARKAEQTPWSAKRAISSACATGQWGALTRRCKEVEGVGGGEYTHRELVDRKVGVEQRERVGAAGGEEQWAQHKSGKCEGEGDAEECARQVLNVEEAMRGDLCGKQDSTDWSTEGAHDAARARGY